MSIARSERPDAPLPRALTIGGSDSSGGAGFAADIETFFALGVVPAIAVTNVTTQGFDGLLRIDPVSPEGISAQIESALASGDIRVARSGMLGSRASVAAVASALVGHPDLVVIVDPVLTASGGGPLLDPDALDSLRQRVLPLATLLTPNLPEASALLGHEIEAEREEDAASTCRALAELGPRSILLKGGHGTGETIRDWLWHDSRLRLFAHPRRPGALIRGTGCTLAAAVTAFVARGETLESAVEKALAYTDGAIGSARPFGPRALRPDRGWNLVEKS